MPKSKLLELSWMFYFSDQCSNCCLSTFFFADIICSPAVPQILAVLVRNFVITYFDLNPSKTLMSFASEVKHGKDDFSRSVFMH